MPSREGANIESPRNAGVNYVRSRPGSFFSWYSMKSVQKLTRAAFLTAVCIVLGYLFLPVPNLEMITAGIFVSGVWMGPRYGLVIGVVAETIYSVFNPMGFPPPPLLVSQVVSMALVGWTGGMMRRLLLNSNFFAGRNWIVLLLLGAVGIILTTIYDLLTNLSFPIAAGFNFDQILASLAFGLPFAAFHISVNCLIFALIIPAFLARFKHWRN